MRQPILFVSIAIIIGMSVWAPPAQASLIMNAPKALGLTNGLVGWWTFDGKDMAGTQAYDMSGNFNHCTLTNGPVRAIGKIGQGMSFDGVDDYALCDPLDNNSTPLTVSAWVKLDSLPSFASVFSISNSGSNTEQFALDYFDVAGVKKWEAMARSVDTTFHPARSTTEAVVGVWVHLTAVFVSATERKIYVNGVFEGTNTDNITPTGQNKMDIGIFGDSTPNGQFPGLIDDVRIYNRALSADEIKRLYKIGATVKLNSTLDGPQSGLVGWWTFDGKDMAGVQAYDRSGNRNQGNLTNGPTRTIGKLGQALSFDGVDDYVDMGDINAIDGLKRITASAWVKHASVGGLTSEQHIVDKSICVGTPTDGPFELFGGLTTQRKAEFVVYSNGLFNSGSSITSVDDGNWHHLIGVYDGTSVSLYVDGVKEASNSSIGSVTLNSSDTALAVGGKCNAPGSTIYWRGLIDDVRIYNRALSADEIKRLYKIGATLKVNSTLDGPQSGLVGWWTFDGKDMAGAMNITSARTAYDRSGQGNNGLYWNATGTPPVIGKIGQALNFDGVDDYVSLSSGPSLKGKSAGTISVWYRPNDVSNGLENWVYYESTANDGSVRFGIMQDINGDLIANMRDTENGTRFFATEPAPFIAKNWYHIVETVDSDTDELLLYRNGVRVASDTTAKGTFTAGNPANIIAIGASTYSGGFSFAKGSIDDVRVYNRALSADEIKRLYNMGR